MSREDIVAILVRLFGLYMLFVAIRALPALATVLSDSQEGAVALAASLVATGLFAALLWFFPLTIARKLLPAASESPAGAALDAKTAWALAISAVGVWLVARALTDAVYWLVFYLRSREVGAELAQLPPGDQAGMVATLVELLIGLFLTFGSSGLRGLLMRLRYGAHHDAT